MKIRSNNQNGYFEISIIMPTFVLDKKTESLDKSIESTSFLKVPINIMLTINEKYCIFELAFIFGLRIIIKEN